MNKNAIKKFAIEARKKLIASVSDRAGMLGITPEGCSEPISKGIDFEVYKTVAGTEVTLGRTQCEQRRKLKEQIDARGFDAVVEEVAYTWFNRICAIRFMEVNDYLPTRVRVLSSEKEGKNEPDIVTQAPDVDLDFTDKEREYILDCKMNNKLDDLFKMLFVKQCNKLSEILPELFEATEDYTELLFSISYVNMEDVVRMLVDGIAEIDFKVSLDADEEGYGQVEIIGWLYQYYNTEPKNIVFSKQGKMTKEEIPAATQLFTPEWIVRYMVENSLGRMWIEGHPNSELKRSWSFYLEETAQEEFVNKEITNIREYYKDIKPEKIKFIDPCMGSGHILVYAFDVFMQIYENAGWSRRDAVQSIIENNIYGLDIDDRAAQLSYFAVMMKARQYDRRIFSKKVNPNVYAIRESNKIDRKQLKYFGFGLSEKEREKAINQTQELLNKFTDAKEYGSLINVDNYDWELLNRFIEDINTDNQISFETYGIEQTVEQIKRMYKIGQIMSGKYEIVSSNPPYMGNMPSRLAEYVLNRYPIEKYDLYAVFTKRCREMACEMGYISMITQQAWMFLSSFEKFRMDLANTTILSLLQLGAHAFDEIGGEVVQTVIFVFSPMKCDNYIGSYMDLTRGASEEEKKTMFFDKKVIGCKQEVFEMIPGCVFAYHMPKVAMELFQGKRLSDYSVIKSGIVTGNNDYFLKTWFEIEYDSIDFRNNEFVDNTNIRWVPMHKGGGYRKHYGLHDYVMNLHDIWEPSKTKSNVRRGDTNFYFKEGLTWSTLANDLSVRRSPIGFVFDTKGSMCFINEYRYLSYFEALLNSKVASYYMSFLSPTLDFNQGAMGKLPVVMCEGDVYKRIIELSEINVEISKTDWDSFETSWDFECHPLVKLAHRKKTSGEMTNDIDLEECYANWEMECAARFDRLRRNEEELNQIFINAYGLQDELTPEIEDKNISVCKADIQREIKSLISYAVGCMFGRYSLDVLGVAFAGGKWDDNLYLTFKPDKDNVIPIADEEYFEDDIVAKLCLWVKSVFGAKTLEKNLDFIAKALNIRGNTSREIIRSYFLNDFYRDHCNTYSVTGSGKRPVYWLFDSGKQNGFKALIYIHNYSSNIVGRVRIDYLHKAQKYVEAAMESAQYALENSMSTSEKAKATKAITKYTKQLAEMRIYDEAIAHIANQRVELSLSDGIKVNYEKFQGVEVAQEGKKTLKIDLLAKIK